jgi:hypothetical protein
MLAADACEPSMKTVTCRSSSDVAAVRQRLVQGMGIAQMIGEDQSFVCILAQLPCWRIAGRQCLESAAEPS